MENGLGKSQGGDLANSAKNGDSLVHDGTVQEFSGDSSVDECLASLDRLIGLQAVKNQVRKLLSMQQANQVRRQEGLPEVPLTLHLVFTGDAGTGKTTVARIIANLYKAANLLPKGTLLETDRSGLIAGYVGQTALKVAETIEQADGGVLYIDEAYSLFQGGGQDFGAEAIATLVKGMEDRRSTLAVIVSGYDAEMHNFIDSNPGLQSRFRTYVRFPNYSPEELVAIFERFADSHKIGVEPEVRNRLLSHFNSIDDVENRGNARYVRNLFESMYSEMAMAAAKDGDIRPDELMTFQTSHLPALESDERRIFGFA
jgi:SpoVK/Ycf46/Vps4 family AAA+-type ATPase